MTQTTPYASAMLNELDAAQLCKNNAANGYLTPRQEDLGYTLINDRMVPESFIQRVASELVDAPFCFEEVLRVIDIFEEEFLESLSALEREVLMPVVLHLLALGEVGFVWKSSAGEAAESSSA